MTGGFLRTSEHEALRALGILLYATNRQLQAYTGHAAASYTREATAGLIRGGLVAGQPRYEARRRGAAEMIYTLTEKGKRFLAAEGVAVLPKSTWTGTQRVDLFQNHLLAITDLILLLKRYCEITGAVITDMRHDLFLKRDPIRVSEKATVRPDLWTVIDTGGRSVFLWWEIDRGTERDPAQWREKVRRIAAGFDAALAKFSAPTMTVAIVTTTPDRAQRLASWTQDALAAYPRLRQIFRFTINERMADPVNFLEGRHWLTLAWTFDSLIEKPQSSDPVRSSFTGREGLG